MRIKGWTSILALLIACGCASDKKSIERGPQGTIAYYVSVESSEPGVKIEANGDYIGVTPCTLKIFGDKDGTFHNFGSHDYIVRATPSRAGELEQTKVFHTGGWFSSEDMVPKRIYFEMDAPQSAVQTRANANTSTSPILSTGIAIALPQREELPKLMLFAGEGHKTYLGCLNCDSSAADSIFNEFGDHGSKFSEESIWNQFSPFGGKFGMYSPFNEFSTDPPVIVDPAGNFYGRLTMNKLQTDRTRIEALNVLLEGWAKAQ